MNAFIALIQALPSFFQALPYLCQVALKAIQVVERLEKWVKENKIEDRIRDIESATDQLEKAKTPDEKWDSAGKFVDIIRRIK